MERYREHIEISEHMLAHLRCDIWNSQRTDKKQKIWTLQDFLGKKRSGPRKAKPGEVDPIMHRLKQYQNPQ
jgi:hypothetical protein